MNASYIIMNLYMTMLQHNYLKITAVSKEVVPSGVISDDLLASYNKYAMGKTCSIKVKSQFTPVLRTFRTVSTTRTLLVALLNVFSLYINTLVNGLLAHHLGLKHFTLFTIILSTLQNVVHS